MWYDWISRNIGFNVLVFGKGVAVPEYAATLELLACVFIGYLLGSINSAIITSKALFDKDIRNFGSGNAGLTNMLRVFGKKAALFTLLGDMLKSALSVLLGAWVCYNSSEGAHLAGLFCVLGHIAPIYYGFRGGKGVLAAATMILVLDPVVFLLLIATFALVLFMTRFVSMASVIAAFLYPAYIYVISMTLTGDPPRFFKLLFAVVTAVMVIFMHRKNIERVYKGTENKFSFKSKPTAEKSEDDKKDDDDDDDDDDVEYIEVYKK